MLSQNDRVRLQHMLDATKEALAFAGGSTRDDFNHARMLTLALVKSIEIIGEAASRVSMDLRKQQPEIPWVSIVGMRNRLIHGYFEIDVEQVYDTVTSDLPLLGSALEKILDAGETES